jgi:hypothetical protein
VISQLSCLFLVRKRRSKLTRSRPLPARKPNLQRSSPIRLRRILKPILLNKLCLRRKTRRLAKIGKQALPIPALIPKSFPRVVVRSRASSVSHAIDDRAASTALPTGRPTERLARCVCGTEGKRHVRADWSLLNAKPGTEALGVCACSPYSTTRTVSAIPESALRIDNRSV